MARRALCALLGLIACSSLLTTAHGLYSGGDVVVLTQSNFKDKLAKGVWLTEFYAPW